MGNSSDNSTARPKKTLLVLAAGMGSRYGGLKQLDRFGPTGETILDYSIYDAIRNGFNKVVFIIRESFSEDFKNFFSSKFDDLVEVHYVYQELDVLPQKQLITKDLSSREKPWGTAHAVWVAKDVIHEPFVVINADDFYGEGAFAVVSTYFDTLKGKENSDFEYALISYDLEKTLSDHGTVNRGVCSVDGHGYLNTIEETLAIGYNDLGVISYHVDQNEFTLDAKTPVSMNFWAFGPDYFAYCEKYFFGLPQRPRRSTQSGVLHTLVNRLFNKDRPKKSKSIEM